MKLPSVFWHVNLQGGGVSSHSLTSVKVKKIVSQFPAIQIEGEKLTDASSSTMIRSISFVAHATIRAQSIDAAAVTAQIRNRVAFVNI